MCIRDSTISANYGNTDVLTDISFSIEHGDFVGLAGPNGAGKTTLVKAILGLIPLSKGSIAVSYTHLTLPTSDLV